MRSSFGLWFGAGLLAIWPASTAAEPITAVYDVHVTFQSTFPGATGRTSYEPFDQTFSLFMTFNRTRLPGGGYGPPAFSAVPLPGISPPTDTRLFGQGWTVHANETQNRDYDLYAEAVHIEGGAKGEWEYIRGIHMLTSFRPGTLDQPVVFTAETFPAHLVLGASSLDPLPGRFNFLFSTVLRSVQPGGGFSSVAFHGLASLREVRSSDPVPEPATLLMTVGGLTLLGMKRLRRPSREQRPV